MRKRHPHILIYFVFIFFISLLCNSCNKNEDDDNVPEPVQILHNTDMESGIYGDLDKWGPKYWFDFVDPPDGDLDLAWSEDVYYSSTRSLMISSSISYDSTAGGWGQFINSGIITNQNIKLTVKIKAENLEGLGAAILIIAYKTPQYEMLKFESTEGTIDINGTFDWKEYSLVMDSVPEETNAMFVYLIYLPQTTGTVYFDDAKLTYEDT